MSFVRTVKRENPFVQMDKYFLDDDNLSWSAKGILAYILSKPDTWKIRKEDLVRRSDDGRARVEAALLNLMSNGYINWYQEKNQDGTFGDWVYDVYERPEFNPAKDECIKEGQARINVRKSKTKERNNKKSPKVDNQLSELPKTDYPLSDYPISDNQLYSNNDFINNDFSNNDLKEEEEEEENKLQQLISIYEKNISTTGKEIVKAKLKEWITKLPYEVIKAELENCSLFGAKSFNYVLKALNEDLKLNISTIEGLQEKYNKHQEKSSSSMQQKTPSKTNFKKGRVELLPEWFNQAPNYTQQQTEINGTIEITDNDEIKQRKDEINRKLAAFRN